MKIKYSICKWNPYAASQFSETTKSDTEHIIIDSNSLTIDGEEYEFDTDTVEWISFKNIMDKNAPFGLMELTDGRILEAHRENGELYLTIRMFYTDSIPPNCDNQYHEVIL